METFVTFEAEATHVEMLVQAESHTDHGRVDWGLKAGHCYGVYGLELVMMTIIITIHS